MKKNIIIVIILILLAGCGFLIVKATHKTSSKDASTTDLPASSTTTPSQEQTQPSQEASDTITIKDLAFSPATITIKAGGTITWYNKDTMTHTVKADGFTSPDIKPGATYSHTFNAAGTYNYICGIHPSMHGTVVVQ